MGFLEGLVKLADGLTDSWTTRKAINHVLQKYGEVTRLKIDRRKKSIELELVLHGESDAIALSVSSYEYDKPKRAGEAGFIKLHGITASRQWIEQVARDYLDNRVLTVPPDTAKYLSMVL